MKKLGITLLTKGSAVYFHNERLVRILMEAGYQVTFICTTGAASRMSAISAILGCTYVDSDIQLNGGRPVERIVSAMRYARKLYLSRDSRNFRRNFSVELRVFSWYRIMSFFSASFLAWFSCLTRAIYFLEIGILRYFVNSSVITKENFDVLLIGGLGLKNSIGDGLVTIVGRKNGIRTVNAIINYDALTAKGYRGCPVEKLVVWGNTMRQDAIKIHAIPAERVYELGSLRYNLINTVESRFDFFTEQLLDSTKKTIFFCGSAFPAHYLEMLKVYDLLVKDIPSVQMVIRPYPSKPFLESAFMEYLGELIQSRPGIRINDSMPDRTENVSKEFLALDDVTYWNYIRHSDVIVNFYSSVAIDALIFEKPTICLDYSPDTESSHGRTVLSNLASLYIHHQRCCQYDVVRFARSRDSLLFHLKNELKNEDRPVDLGRFKSDECGPTNEKAIIRFIELLEG